MTTTPGTSAGGSRRGLRAALWVIVFAALATNAVVSRQGSSPWVSLLLGAVTLGAGALLIVFRRADRHRQR